MPRQDLIKVSYSEHGWPVLTLQPYNMVIHIEWEGLPSDYNSQVTHMQRSGEIIIEYDTYHAACADNETRFLYWGSTCSTWPLLVEEVFELFQLDDYVRAFLLPFQELAVKGTPECIPSTDLERFVKDESPRERNVHASLIFRAMRVCPILPWECQMSDRVIGIQQQSIPFPRLPMFGAHPWAFDYMLEDGTAAIHASCPLLPDSRCGNLPEEYLTLLRDPFPILHDDYRE